MWIQKRAAGLKAPFYVEFEAPLDLRLLLDPVLLKYSLSLNWLIDQPVID